MFFIKWMWLHKLYKYSTRENNFHKKGIYNLNSSNLPADDLTKPTFVTTFAHLDANYFTIKRFSHRGIYLHVDFLDSTSTMFQLWTLGEKLYKITWGVKQTLQRYNKLQDIIVILGLDELSKEDRLNVTRAQKIECFLSKLFLLWGFL
jgi:F-type H+-transporting ATPase subunit beta